MGPHPDTTHRVTEFHRQALLAEVARQQARNRAFGRSGQTSTFSFLAAFARTSLTKLTVTVRAFGDRHRATHPTPTDQRGATGVDAVFPRTGS